MWLVVKKIKWRFKWCTKDNRGISFILNFIVCSSRRTYRAHKTKLVKWNNKIVFLMSKYRRKERRILSYFDAIYYKSLCIDVRLLRLVESATLVSAECKRIHWARRLCRLCSSSSLGLRCYNARSRISEIGWSSGSRNATTGHYQGHSRSPFFALFPPFSSFLSLRLSRKRQKTASFCVLSGAR